MESDFKKFNSKNSLESKKLSVSRKLCLLDLIVKGKA